MRAAIRALPAGQHTAPELAAWASLPPLYHRWAMGPGGEAYVVAERRGRILGYAARRGGELTAVFVRPRAQGHGLGRALVEAVCAAAASQSHRTIHVLAARIAAGFYAALGFHAGGRTRAPLPGGVSLAAVRMSARLRGGGAPAQQGRARRPRRRGGGAGLVARSARRGGGTGSAGRPRARRGEGRTPRPPRCAPDR